MLNRWYFDGDKCLFNDGVVMSDLISSELTDDEKNSWCTDPNVFKVMDNEFKFYLDAAASYGNNLCESYFTKEDDALSYDWFEYLSEFDGPVFNKSVWINPPYGRGYIKKFMQKCIEENKKGITSVMLVPSTLDAQWLPINEISEIRIVTGGRLNFLHPITGKKVSRNTKGSMFVIFRPTTMPCFVRLIDRDETFKKKS